MSLHARALAVGLALSAPRRQIETHERRHLADLLARHWRHGDLDHHEHQQLATLLNLHWRRG